MALPDKGWPVYSDQLIADYLIVHAERADEDGHHVACAVMYEAARRLLKLADRWPTLADTRPNGIPPKS